MMIQVVNQAIGKTASRFELATEKKSASINYNRNLGIIGVCCKNASHRAWKGTGRNFNSFDEAKAAYKSSDMKAMIEFVERECR